MRICFLGTRNVDPELKTSLGLVVQERQQTILLDAGPYAVQGLHGIGLSPDDLQAVFVSHDHADHCGGIPALIMTWALASQKQPESITWAVPHDDLAMLTYARHAYPFFFTDTAPRRIEVSAATSLSGKDAFGIEFLKLDHTLETWGAIIRTPTASVAYLPDSSREGLIRNAPALRGVQNVVMSVFGSSSQTVDAARFKFCVAKDAGQLCAEWGSARLYVQHMVNASESAAVADEVGQYFEGDVIFPEVGDWLEIA